MNIIFTVLFVLGVIYLIKYRLNLKKAADCSKDALFPKKEHEFSSILLPTEWKEMEPLTKHTKSYQYVKWGTMIALVLLTVLLIIVISTDWLGSSFFSFAYLFFTIISAIKHRGNLFILPNGLILHGKFYSSDQIKYYETEKVIRWHELYGLDSRVNNAYKLTFHLKNRLFQPSFIVVRDLDHLEKIIGLLNEQSIMRIQKEKKPYSSVVKLTNKS
ncbi:hypothetical protein V7122_19625 [Bacillus sp. JJ1532]|uniref:hypothetical protein n=1 Tax=unclassified Bacillus (in: firmicutes) TaxID=185979 RepID=UPI002FFFA5CE